ncbi:MAG TPA: hypothetical protein VHL57_06595 [Flavobacteriales bacterium]|jgi:hypothetical protein|nr:hypothetical protein [Flavobacteriales bacterium]
MSKLDLSIDCQERWEDMRPCTGGRFCGACDKPVIDFTTWPRAEVIRHLQQHPGTCGQYLPEQLDPTLVPLHEVGAKARRGFFAALAALALHSVSNAQGTAPQPPTEQTPPSPQPRSKKAIQAPKPGMLAERNGNPVCIRTEPVVKHFDRRKKHLYLSRSFPFIEIRKPKRGRVRSRALLIF